MCVCFTCARVDVPPVFAGACLLQYITEELLRQTLADSEQLILQQFQSGGPFEAGSGAAAQQHLTKFKTAVGAITKVQFASACVHYVVACMRVCA